MKHQPTPPGAGQPAMGRSRARRAGIAAALLLAVLAVTVAACEAAGWPFLADTVQRTMAGTLKRSVLFAAGPATAGGEPPMPRFALHLFNGIRLDLAQLTVGNADWATGGPLVQAERLSLRAAWSDLLRWRSGQPVPLRELAAGTLKLNLQRDAAQRANWQLGAAHDGPSAAATRFDGATVRRADIREGQLQWRDETLKARLAGPFSWHEPGVQANRAQAPRSGAASSSPANDAGNGPSNGPGNGPSNGPGDSPSAGPGAGLRASLNGHFRDQPMVLNVSTGSTRPWWERGAVDDAVPVALRLRTGRVRLDFQGQVKGAWQDGVLLGRYEIAGPSLAAVGQPAGVVLPSTGAFEMRGSLHHAGRVWSTVVDAARIGKSQFSGALQFTQATAGGVPRLAGHVKGQTVQLADLGPVIGKPVSPDTGAPRSTRVLPSRPLELSVLKTMQADVMLDFDRLDTGSEALQDIRSLHTQIGLRDGVLTLSNIDAAAAQGHLSGMARIDASKLPARWLMRLQLQGLKLEQWVQPLRRAAGTPWASGRIDARLDLAGGGDSVAQVLGRSDGRMALLWRQGQLSHLAVELMGLDVAQSLGVLIKGDDALPVVCGVADLQVSAGVIKAQPVMVDTRDSLLQITGLGNFANEQLELKLVAQPKDFSPISLRSPLTVTGTFAAPQVSIQAKPFVAKLAIASVLAAAVAPLAALLPLLDMNSNDTREASATCAAAFARATRDAKARPAPPR